MMQPKTYKEERELDALIAGKVMSARVGWEKNTPYVIKGEKDVFSSENTVPNYCTSIGAAMSLAMELRRKGFKIEIVMDAQGIVLACWDADGNEIVKYENIISKFSWFMCQMALTAVE